MQYDRLYSQRNPFEKESTLNEKGFFFIKEMEGDWKGSEAINENDRIAALESVPVYLNP